MPGQRKRKRQQRTGVRRGDGRWEVLFETQDESELRAERRRMRAKNRQPDPETLRIDTFCGRLTRPTTYRLRVFVSTTES